MYSEDPYLVAQLGTAAVRGLQGGGETLGENHVFATPKHFVHGQPENGTNGAPSDYSEHTMRSIFFYPFEQAVKNAHIEAVMLSYNETMGGPSLQRESLVIEGSTQGRAGLYRDYGLGLHRHRRTQYRTRNGSR